MTIDRVPVFNKDYNGRAIRVNAVDRYVCLTDMAVASGKKLGHWNQLESTSAYLEALSEATGIAIGTLLCVRNGTTTWAHPKVAIKFAAWCSPRFEVQITTWIDELLTTGSVSIVPEQSDDDIKWQKERQEGKLVRREYTNSLAKFKPTSLDYARATNQNYLGLLGQTAAEIKQSRGLSKKQSARDGLNDIELAAVRLTELAVARNQSIASAKQLELATYTQAQAVSVALKAI